MQVKRRLVTAVVGLAATAVALTACAGGSSSGGAGATSASAEPSSLTGTVTFWDTSATTEEATMKSIIGAFQQKYPNIVIDYQRVEPG
ncbi:MAG: hypothetical protein RLZ55_1608, partial [Actinomycetota bacterium]